tara:strand:- start:176 stop:970 length:795 start_codon:yes stop_codon:yes gene_type:complete
MKINFAKNFLIIATLVFLSSCEVEDTSGYNCIPGGCVSDVTGAQYSTLEECQVGCAGAYINNDPIDPGDQSWGWSITLDGNTYAEACDEWNNGYYENGESGAYLYSGNLTFNLTIDDITEECYVSGDYLSLRFNITSPYEGPNVATVSSQNTGTCSWHDYFGLNYLGLGYYLYSGFSEIPSDSIYYNSMPNTLTIEISSLGTGSSIDPTTGQVIYGERLVGSYSGTIYKLPNDYEFTPTTGEYYVPMLTPVSLEINFSLLRFDN